MIEGKKEQTIKGIYKIDGDKLTICVEDDYAGTRPNAFVSPPRTKRMIWTLTRTKKKKE